MTHSPEKIRAAIEKARAQTNWNEPELVIDTATMILVGHQASNEALDAARNEVVDVFAQLAVEGR